MFSLVLLIVLFSQNYLPTNLSSSIIVVFGFFVFIITRHNFSVSYLKFVYPLVCILLLGIFSSVGNDIYHISRDIVFALTPISLLLIGGWLANSQKMQEPIFKILVLCGVIIALTHVIKIVLQPELLGKTIMEIKNEIGLTGDLVALSIVFGVLQNHLKLGNLFPKIFPRVIALPILFLSFFLSYSRTEFLVLIVMCLSLLGLFTKFNFKFVLTIMVLILSLVAVAMSTPNDEVGTFRSKLLRSFTEVTISDYRDFQDISDNWRGFEAHRAVVTFSSGNATQYVIGQGFGALIDLGFTMQLGEGEFRAIPVTHNGYAYILVKVGLLGLLMYIIFFLQLFLHAIVRSNSENEIERFFSRLLLGCVLSLVLSMFVVGGIAEAHNIELTLLVGYLVKRLKQLRLERIWLTNNNFSFIANL